MGYHLDRFQGRRASYAGSSTGRYTTINCRTDLCSLLPLQGRAPAQRPGVDTGIGFVLSAPKNQAQNIIQKIPNSEIIGSVVKGNGKVIIKSSFSNQKIIL